MVDYIKYMLKDRYIKFATYSLCATSIFILIYNILHYDPIEGYDAEAHYSYLHYIAMYLPYKISIPSIEFTREFFNPPIPYLFPAGIQVVCRNVIVSENYINDCQQILGTATQAFQSILYIVTMYFYLLSFKILKKNKNLLNINLILIISLLAVNYRTISMIRGEIYILFFNSILMYKLLKISNNKFIFKTIDVLIAGTLIGCMALSRQWAFLLFLSYIFIVFFLENEYKNRYLKFISYSFLLGFFISSWFYFNLFFEYGSFTSFNKDPLPFNFKNQNLDFYIPFNSEFLIMFYKPIRPYFSNQFFPILYSDLWGDYWGHFVFTSRDLLAGRNQMLIGSYLARVNIVSLIPTVLILYSLFKSKKLKGSKFFHKFLKYGILFSFFGYLWFLIKYPEIPTGDTIKATYIIQMFHLIGFIFASYLEDLKNKNLKTYFIILAFLLFAYVHNFSTYLSHFPIKY